jgi:hypothetical protein
MQTTRFLIFRIWDRPTCFRNNGELVLKQWYTQATRVYYVHWSACTGMDVFRMAERRESSAPLCSALNNGRLAITHHVELLSHAFRNLGCCQGNSAVAFQWCQLLLVKRLTPSWCVAQWIKDGVNKLVLDQASSSPGKKLGGPRGKGEASYHYQALRAKPLFCVMCIAWQLIVALR